MSSSIDRPIYEDKKNRNEGEASTSNKLIDLVSQNMKDP